MAEAPKGPLVGVRVVELATVVAGPGVGKYLADFGADVIKVEPPGGDPTRRMGWTGPGEVDSYFWKLLNRNKRTIALDLKSPEGRAALWALLADADVLIENMRPGKLERLGFGPSAVHARNASLVMLRVSGFGQDGPYAQRPGFATIAEALSGLASLLGEPGRPAAVAADRLDRRGHRAGRGVSRRWPRFAMPRRLAKGRSSTSICSNRCFS